MGVYCQYMTEAALQTKLTKMMRGTHWRIIMEEMGWSAVAIEVKVCAGDKLAMSAVRDHQILELMRAGGTRGERAMTWKGSDSAIGYKPLDMVVMYGCEAWLVVGFNGGREVFAVEIDELLSVLLSPDGTRKRGSITEAWTREIAVIDLTEMM